MTTAIAVAFGLSYVAAGLLTGWVACGGTEIATEDRRESTVLALQIAGLAVVAVLAIAGGTCTIWGAIR